MNRSKIAARLLAGLAAVVMMVAGPASAASAHSAADPPVNAPHGVSAKVTALTAGGATPGGLTVTVRWSYSRAAADLGAHQIHGFRIQTSHSPDRIVDPFGNLPDRSTDAADAAADGMHSFDLTISRTAASQIPDGVVYLHVSAYHDSADRNGPTAVTYAQTSGAGVAGVEAVDNDSPADAVGVVRDYALENSPIIVGVIGAIFLVGLTFYLIRRGLMKARGAMRL